MIELLVKQYLDTALDVPVDLEIPEKMPETFVRIEKTGGGEQEHICTATLAVQSYAPSLYQAAELNEKVKAAMRELITLDRVTRVQLNSDYPFYDTARKRRRYQAVFDITHY